MSRPSVATRDRLLEAAADVYAEQGYRNARIREICERAGANIASINYHFGDKRGLYHEVLRHAFLGIAGSDPVAWDAGSAATPEERLRAFVRSLVAQLLSDGRSALYTKLLTRELSDPTPALEQVIEEGIRPQVESLFSIVRELVGKKADKRHVHRCVGSILGQCLYYRFARPVISHMELEKKLDVSVVEDLVDHITSFSLAGLTGRTGS